MKHFKFSRLFAVTLVAAGLVLALAGCKQPSFSVSDDLVGTWKSQYGDGYTITDSTIKYDDGGYGYGFEAEIDDIDEPYIYYIINDKYFAIAYKDLADGACKFANAYKANGKTYCDSLDEAKEEFTIENGYYSYFGEYVRKD